MTPVEILEEIIRSKKSSLFLRHSTATEKEVKSVAQMFYYELVGPYTEAYSTIKTSQSTNSNQLALDFQ